MTLVCAHCDMRQSLGMMVGGWVKGPHLNHFCKEMCRFTPDRLSPKQLH